MTPAALLLEVRRRGGSFTLDGDGLTVCAPKALPSELVERLHALKPELIELVTLTQLVLEQCRRYGERDVERCLLDALADSGSALVAFRFLESQSVH